MKIDKAYYTLAEVRAHWPLPDPDIVYLAENGKLGLYKVVGAEVGGTIYRGKS